MGEEAPPVGLPGSAAWVGHSIPCCAGEQWSTRDPALSSFRAPARVAHPRVAQLRGPSQVASLTGGTSILAFRPAARLSL